MAIELTRWKDRIDGVRYLNERVLFVTPEEYEELRSYQAVDPDETEQQRRDRLLRESIARMNGALDHFMAMPIVVDADKALAQRDRIKIELATHTPAEGSQ